MSGQPDWSGDWRAKWVQLLSGADGQLHRAAAVEWGPQWARGAGAVLCGRSGRVCVPGYLSRLQAPRCPQCCELAGVLPGNGNPHNDPQPEGQS